MMVVERNDLQQGEISLSLFQHGDKNSLDGTCLVSSSSSSDRSLSSLLILCLYRRAFHSLTSSTLSSLFRYSVTLVGRAGSYISSQSVSTCFCCFFFLFLRPPRCRFSPKPYRHSSSSVAAQSASVVFWGADEGNGAALGTGTVLGAGALGLAGCLTCGRRTWWTWRAGWKGFFDGGSEEVFVESFWL